MKRRRSANLKAASELGLPAPRLQFRWERIAKPVDGFNWMCHYELVIRLDTYDIRNPNEYKKPGELVCPLGGTRVGKENRTPIWPDGTVDTPFRDGAHATWDRAQLGNLPVFAICDDIVTDVTQLRTLRDEKAA